MNTQLRGDYLLVNNELILASSFNPGLLETETKIYEIIRVIRGVSLFLEEHLDRLAHSAKLAGIKSPLPLKDIRNGLSGLTVINKINEGNIRLEIAMKEQHNIIAAWFVHHSYPTEEQYTRGVDLTLFEAERNNPNAKIVQHSLREMIGQSIAEKKVYEALLVNRFNHVTEGSRSNFFLIRNNELYTAPSEEILEGISRKMLLNICKEQSITCHEISTQKSELNSFEAAFITGTSPKILPVSSADTVRFNPHHPLLRKLMKLFDNIIDQYICSHS